MDTKDILIHPKTKKAAEQYLKTPTQVLTLIGPEGAGKRFFALKLAAKLLDKADLSNESRLITITRQDDKKEIAIDAVRMLIKTLRLKQPGQSIRVVFIDEADRLSQEAQNALLKTLEQPNSDTLFILSVSDASRLLPTVFSRTQKLIIHPVDKEQAEAYFSKNASAEEVRRAWMLSEGYVGQLSVLLGDDELQPLKNAVGLAKKFLASSRYERLLEVDSLSKDREQTLGLLTGLARILKSLHHSNIRNGRQNVSFKILNARKLVKESQTAINANASAKAVLLKLILNLQV